MIEGNWLVGCAHSEPDLGKVSQASPMPGGISLGATSAPLPMTQGPFSCVTSELRA